MTMYRLMFPDLTPTPAAPSKVKRVPLPDPFKALGHPTMASAMTKRLDAIARGTGVGAGRRATTAHPCCRCDWHLGAQRATQACVCGEQHKGCKVHGRAV